jgi:uncharacterized protein YbbK (DUF523 family)
MPAVPPTRSDHVRVGVSACLLGQAVRYDGGHKRDAWLVETLGHLVEFVPVCPEFELGLGVPRASLRLESHPEGIRLIAPASAIDHTAAMRTYAHARVAALASEHLSGYVLKSNSPSCGMNHVRIFAAHGMPPPDGRGLFAEALIAHFPDLPIEEEGRLEDALSREDFIERVFAYYRSGGLLARQPT